MTIEELVEKFHTGAVGRGGVVTTYQLAVVACSIGFIAGSIPTRRWYEAALLYLGAWSLIGFLAGFVGSSS